MASLLMAVLASGLWCLMRPEAVARFRVRMGWSTSFWSGGFAYATVGRIRLTGALLVVVAASAMAVLIIER